MKFWWIWICLLVNTVQCTERHFDHMGHVKGWFTGHNICVHTEFLETRVTPLYSSHKEAMTCSGNDEEYVCLLTLNNGSTLKKSYKCCFGYIRVTNSEFGCRKKKVQTIETYKPDESEKDKSDVEEKYKEEIGNIKDNQWTRGKFVLIGHVIRIGRGIS